MIPVCPAFGVCPDLVPSICFKVPTTAMDRVAQPLAVEHGRISPFSSDDSRIFSSAHFDNTKNMSPRSQPRCSQRPPAFDAPARHQHSPASSPTPAPPSPPPSPPSPFAPPSCYSSPPPEKPTVRPPPQPPISAGAARHHQPGPPTSSVAFEPSAVSRPRPPQRVSFAAIGCAATSSASHTAVSAIAASAVADVPSAATAAPRSGGA